MSGQFGFNHSKDSDEAEMKICSLLQNWLSDVKNKQMQRKWKGIHDEGTFATAWREYYQKTNDPNVKELAKKLLDGSSEWIAKKWKYGYAKVQEVHHGVEHFIIFLAWMQELFPDNENLKLQLRNAAKNIIQTERKKTIWYDFEKKRFKSTHLGTKFVGKESINIVEHLRLVRMAWLGLWAGGDPLLKDVIFNYTNEWIDAFEQNDEVPVYLDPDETQMQKFQKALSTFVGAAPKEMNHITRSELHIANGTPDLFMDLYKLTKDTRYLNATKKILLPVLGQLDSPYAHPVGDLLWRFYQLESSSEIKEYINKLHKKILEDVEAGVYNSISAELLDNYPWKNSKYHLTIGIRRDMPKVNLKSLDKEIEIPSPATFGLIYRMTGDTKMLHIGLEYAAGLLSMAIGRYPDGRDHGCDSRAIHSFCVGHGRNWGSGNISTILRATVGNNCFGIKLPPIDK